MLRQSRLLHPLLHRPRTPGTSSTSFPEGRSPSRTVARSSTAWDRSGTQRRLRAPQGHRGDQVAARHDPRPPSSILHQRPAETSRPRSRSGTDARQQGLSPNRVRRRRHGVEARRAAQAQAATRRRRSSFPGPTAHGTAYGGTSARVPEYREGWGELVPGHIHVPGDDVEALARVFADGVQRSPVITEPVQGAGGSSATRGYLQADASATSRRAQSPMR